MFENYHIIILILIIIVIIAYLSSGPKESPHIYINPTTSYQYILSSKTWTKKFDQFLTHIFNLIPPTELYNFICMAYASNPKINDLEMFTEVKDYTKTNYSKLTLTRNFHIFLNKQEKHIGKCIKKLLPNAQINNYINIGDSGKYVNILRSILNIGGNVYTINDSYNYFEHINSPISIFKNNFIKYDYEEMKPFEINDEIDLVTCLIGLHHFREDKLDNFLKNVYDILQPNGYFIIREHDGHKDIIPLLNCAHNVFNAVTGEDINTEQNELRNFKPIQEWINIVESIGFKHVDVYAIQKNDPTKNLFILFTKLNDTKINITCDKNKNYVTRSQCQTYLTTPEWFSVDIIKSYGNFMEHTPWYNFWFSPSSHTLGWALGGMAA